MQHIIGLTLFAFIVSATAVICAFFNVPEVTPVFEVKNSPVPPTVSTRYACQTKRWSRSIEVKQAVFDWQTKQFNWELATPAVDEMIELHFFSNDGKNVSYITSERVNSKFSYNGFLKFSNSYSWLDKLSSPENLYVIAQFESEMKNYSENYQAYGNRLAPKFDAAKATAVTVDYGK